MHSAAFVEFFQQQLGMDAAARGAHVTTVEH